MAIELADGQVRLISPPRCIHQAQEACGRRRRHSTPKGDEPLRRMFTDEFFRVTGHRPPLEQLVTCASGSNRGLSLVFEWFGIQNKKIMVFSPVWFGFLAKSQRYGVPLFGVDTRGIDNFAPTAELLREGLSLPGAREVGAVIINNYPTPTGAAIPDTELKAIGRVLLEARQRPVLIEDCLYWKSVFKGTSFGTVLRETPELWSQDRAIGLCSLTKAWALDEESVGFLWGPTDLIHFAETSAWTPIWDRHSAREMGAREAFSDEGLLVPPAIISGVQKNLEILRKMCADVKLPLLTEPQGGTNAFLSVAPLLGKRLGHVKFRKVGDIVRAFAKKGVSVKSGDEFHSHDPCVRINLAGANHATFRTAVERMADVASSALT